MKATVRRLRETLGYLGPVVPKKPTIESLTGVLFQDGQAYANNLEVSATLNFDEADGSCLIPCRQVLDMLKYVPGNEIMTIEQDGKKLQLTWSEGKATYDTHLLDDYPRMHENEFQVEGVVDGDVLIPALLQVMDCCATETERLVLTGVCLSPGDNTLQVAGADGYRLAYRDLPLNFPAPKPFIIPSASIKVLSSLWDKVPRTLQEEPDSLVSLITAKRLLSLALGDNVLKMQFSPVSLVTTLIKGTFPNYLQLIPESPSMELLLFGPDLERAVRRVKETAKAQNGVVCLSWDDGTLTVSAKESDTHQVEVTVPVQTEGGPGRVALNESYLLKYLTGKQGPVTMKVSSESTPVIFRHAASPLVLLMPMSAQWPTNETEAEKPEAEPEPEAVLETEEEE